MITFKPEVFAHQKRQDGTYNVKIRVTFARKSRRIPTTLYCTQADLTRSLKLKNGDIINKAAELCGQMRAACSDLTMFDLEGRDVDFIVRHITSKMTSDTFRLDFFEWSDRFLQSKSEGTRRGYISAVNAFERFLGHRSIDINDITQSMMIEFADSLREGKKVVYDHDNKVFKDTDKDRNPGTVSSLYLGKLSHIFDEAKRKYNDDDSSVILIPRLPFEKAKSLLPPPSGQRSIGRELMQQFISETEVKGNTRLALDAFIVSFGLMGANMADLYYAAPFRGETWVYNRHKTRGRRADKAEMKVDIPRQIRPFLARLQEGEGQWWLRKLHEVSEDKDGCTYLVNYHLKKWCRKSGVSDFTFYAARHTWATLARKAGVEKATVDECLGHVGDYRMADIYAERDWDNINSANKKVLDLFVWPEE